MPTNKQIFELFFEEVDNVMNKVENYAGVVFDYNAQTVDLTPIHNNIAKVKTNLDLIKSSIQNLTDYETSEETTIDEAKEKLDDCEKKQLDTEDEVASFKVKLSEANTKISKLFESSNDDIKSAINGTEKTEIESLMRTLDNQAVKQDAEISDNDFNIQRYQLASEINQLNNNLTYNDGTHTSNGYVNPVNNALDELEYSITGKRSASEILDRYVDAQREIADFRAYFEVWGDI